MSQTVHLHKDSLKDHKHTWLLLIPALIFTMVLLISILFFFKNKENNVAPTSSPDILGKDKY